MPQKMVEMNEEDIREAITFYLRNKVGGGHGLEAPNDPKGFWEMVRRGMLICLNYHVESLSDIRILVPVEEWKP